MDNIKKCVECGMDAAPKFYPFQCEWCHEHENDFQEKWGQ